MEATYEICRKSIGKLVRKSDGPQEIELIMKTMTKYGVDGK
jgi:hypothetical protein